MGPSTEEPIVPDSLQEPEPAPSQIVNFVPPSEVTIPSKTLSSSLAAHFDVLSNTLVSAFETSSFSSTTSNGTFFELCLPALACASFGQSAKRRAASDAAKIIFFINLLSYKIIRYLSHQKTICWEALANTGLQNGIIFPSGRNACSRSLPDGKIISIKYLRTG